jgi:glycosyltransferase involved in cell wall biosynthesis
VLEQTYTNWEHTILNNCSTDGSAAIAYEYAAKDSRIRVLQNDVFLDALPNHNKVLRHISPQSKYCKMVFADDWLFPRCLKEMVAVAERHPTVAMVSAYGLQGEQVKWAGLPYPSEFVRGREVCRRYLLEGMNPFGTAHSVLFRSDVVRARDPFYDESNWHSDRETCVALLRNHDFGFVHQVLTYTRERPGSLNTVAANVNSYVAGTLNDLLLHGSEFLTKPEFDGCLSRLEAEYYNFLSVNLMKGRRDPQFWAYHRRKLAESSVGFSRLRLLRAFLARVLQAVLNPYETVKKIQKAAH